MTHDCLMLWFVFASNSLISDGTLVSKVVTDLAAIYAHSRKDMLDLQVNSLQLICDHLICVFVFFVCNYFFLFSTFKISCFYHLPRISPEMVYSLKCSIKGILPQWCNHCAYVLQRVSNKEKHLSTRDNIPWHSNPQISANQMFMNLAKLPQV